MCKPYAKNAKIQCRNAHTPHNLKNTVIVVVVVVVVVIIFKTKQILRERPNKMSNVKESESGSKRLITSKMNDVYTYTQYIYIYIYIIHLEKD